MIRPDGRYCGQSPVRIEGCRGCVVDHDRARTRARHLTRALAEADLVTYPSAFARDLSRASGLGARADAVWQNGVTLPGPDFADRQAARRARDPRLTFGFCGGPSQLKGWPLIREAFAPLTRQDFRVWLVDGALEGSWWPDVPLSSLPGDWQVRPRYSQGDMDAFWAEIDVLLFPSQWKETFGLTVREALARGVRVIQTDSGGTVEHAGPDRDRLIPVGAGAEALQREILHALDRADRHAEPVPVRGFAAQAEAFVRTDRAADRTTGRLARGPFTGKRPGPRHDPACTDQPVRQGARGGDCTSTPNGRTAPERLLLRMWRARHAPRPTSTGRPPAADDDDEHDRRQPLRRAVARSRRGRGSVALASGRSTGPSFRAEPDLRRAVPRRCGPRPEPPDRERSQASVAPPRH